MYDYYGEGRVITYTAILNELIILNDLKQVLESCHF
jgi:hypothetical protein